MPGAPHQSATDSGTGTLWRHADFNKVWAGETVSVLGTAVTLLALPTLAVLQLGAGPSDVGVLLACQRLPFPFLALTMGAWADRVRRRPLLVAADVGRCLLFGSIPLLDASGHLTLLLLDVIALLAGTLTVVFDVGYMAYVPTLVGRPQLAAANARLEVSYGTSYLAGPGLGGLLIQAIGAARTMLVDALSYALSAVALLSVRRGEPPPPRPTARVAVHREIAAGVGFVLGDPVLRSLLIGNTALVFFSHALEPVMVVFAYHSLGLNPGLWGLVLASAGLGAIPAAILSPRLRSRLGFGRGLVWTAVVAGATRALAPLALLASPVLVLASLELLTGASGTSNNVLQVTLRQLRTPDQVRARMNAAFRTAYWGIWAVANVAGGLLAAWIGPVPTIIGAGTCTVATGIVIRRSAVGRVVDTEELALTPRGPEAARG